MHVVKAGLVRPMVTASTGGAGNVPVSMAEDAVSTSLSLLAIVLPLLIGTLLVVVAVFLFGEYGKKRAFSDELESLNGKHEPKISRNAARR